jgi:toxin CcdB
MQHELFANPNPRTRREFPLVVVLQADVTEGDGRLTAPLVPASTQVRSGNRALPRITHDGQDYLTMLPLLSPLDRRKLRHPLGSLRHHRDDFVRALDWLFVGF